jgi:hypothetical protein
VSFYDQTWKFSSDKVAARRLLGSGDVVILITIASEPDHRGTFNPDVNSRANQNGPPQRGKSTIPRSDA